MILFTFVILACSLTININQQQYNGYDYDSILNSYGSSINTIKSLVVIEGDFTLTSITKQYTQLSTLEIPETSFAGSIPDDKFKDMISLQSIILNGVTSIGSNSFQNCIQLETVQFSSCLTIGNYAFSGCQMLKTVNLPKLTTIGAYGFEKAGITEIELNSVFILNTKLDLLRGLEGCQFSGCSKLTKITMKNSPLIQRYMFENCPSLVYVDMPNCLNIGDRSFIGCNSYNNVTFPLCLSIGDFSFSSLIGLTNVNLPSVNNIGESSFFKCQNLISASFEFCVTIGEECFAECSSLETINFPRLRTIGFSAFTKTSLVEVKLNSLIEIETEFELWIGDVGRQFSSCSRLTSVTMNSLQTLKSYTFEDCGMLNEINIPSCTTIETNSLIGCRNIKKVSLGYLSVNFRSIPDPSILTHVYFPFALALLDGTFSSMTELVSCRLPMVTKIGAAMFRDKTKLTEVLLPRVKEIEGDYTFYNCENLELISLQSLTTVSSSSSFIFQGCSKLKYIYLPDVPPKTFNQATFQGLTCDIVIPKDSISIYDNDLSVEGDVANDNKWCGLELKEYSFVNCSINLLWSGIGFNLHDSVLVSGISESNVLYLRIRSGQITQEEMNSIKNKFINLNELIIDESVTIENEIIPSDFLKNHKEITSVTINCNIKSIESSAFEGCSQLKHFECQSVTELNSRCFYGPTLIESLSFDLVNSIKGSDFFSNNQFLTSIYLPSLAEISITGYVSQNSPSLTTFILSKSPPTVNSGTFLIDVNPNLIGLSNDEAIIYDDADGVNKDMKYYSLNLKYTLITCTIDGKMIGGINLKGTVKEGDEIVQVIEGEIFETDFKLPSSVVSLTIPENVNINKIPRNAMSHNTNLKSVKILSKNSFSIDEEAFAGCTSLESVLIDGATLLNGMAFKDCIHLKTVVLDNVEEIVGNFIFDGCSELPSISFKSLSKVSADSTMIFQGCIKLTTIKLPSNPPKTFNKDIFGGIENHVTISLPSINDYKTYDNDVSIDGDVENDGFWCGILLPTDTIAVRFNDQNNLIYSKDLNDCISSSGIPEASIKSLEILRGIVQVSSFIEAIKKLNFLENLFVSKSVVFNGEFTDGMFSGLDIVSINLPFIQTIPENFFKDCSKLKTIVIDDALKICSSAFSGCESLQSISLNAETFEGDSQFENCNSLAVVSITNLKTVDPSSTKIFSGCPLQSLYLPSNPPKTFNNKVFDGMNVIIRGLAINEMKIYDLNTDVEGDKENDKKWCGIDLIQLYISVSINGNEPIITDSLLNAVESNQINQVNSIEIHQGLVKTSHLNELKSFTSLSSFSISKNAFLESANIEADLFNDMKNLRSVSIMLNVSLLSNCFSGCTSLQSAEFDTVYMISEGAFKDCSSLSILSIPNCVELKGDEIFSGCSSLEEIDLTSLKTVDSSCSKIFEGCSKLSTIKLPSKEPIEFNKDTFKNLNVKLVLPSYDDYIVYDDESHVQGDSKEDEKWCGIDLGSKNLPPLLVFKINDVEHRSRKIKNDETRRSFLLENNDDLSNIKTLELVGGLFDPTVVKNSIIESKSTIEKFEVNTGTLNEILPGTFYECNSLKEIVIHSDTKIGLNALQNIPNLHKISLDLIQTVRNDEFEGDLNLEFISLPSLTTVPNSLFEGLQNLKSVNLNSTSTIYDSCFKNCIVLENIELPKLSLIAGNSHFENCYALKTIDLSGLKTVDRKSESIFKNCHSLSELKLGSEPPNYFNESIFNNSGVVPSISIPNPNHWNNYFHQCTVDSNKHYLWYGYDTGLLKIEKICKDCPKSQKSLVIALAVLTAVFGAGCIGLIITITVMCCNGGGESLFP